MRISDWSSDVCSSDLPACAAAGLVRAKGLEPPHLAILVPKTSASTNSATPAQSFRPGCTKSCAVPHTPVRAGRRYSRRDAEGKGERRETHRPERGARPSVLRREETDDGRPLSQEIGRAHV